MLTKIYASDFRKRLSDVFDIVERSSVIRVQKTQLADNGRFSFNCI